MTHLLRTLVQIALLRRDPSDLPASTGLMTLAGAAYAGASALQSWVLFGDDRLWQRTALDLGLALVLFWLLLSATRRGNRFRQTMTALFGTALLVTPFVLGLLLLQDASAGSQAVRLLVLVGSVTVIIWGTLIIGHILRSALEINFVTSIAIALTWLLASDALMRRLFPVAA